MTSVTQGNTQLIVPLGSLDLHLTQNKKMKTRTDPSSSFPFPESLQKFSNTTPITQIITKLN